MNRALAQPLWRWFAAALALFVLLALAMPADHDEGQYVAAAHFTAKGLLPYRDFAYLQTPLQPFLIAPLAWIAPGWLLVAARLANALAMALAVLLLARTAVRLSGRSIAGPLAVIALVTVDALQFGASVARNDALPFLFLSIALDRLFAAGAVTARRAALAGLCFALAASAKISYAIPAATAAIQALWNARRSDRREVAALLAGMAAGTLPILLALVLLTKPFLFGAYRYSVDAVQAWQAVTGATDLLRWPDRVRRSLTFLSLGPTLMMLVAAAVALARSAPGQLQQPRAIGITLHALVAAGVVAAALPIPTYRQYILPILPPLVLLLGVHGERLLAWLRPRRRLMQGATVLLAASLIAGSGRSIWFALTQPLDRRPLAIEQQAHELGRIGKAKGGGSIAGLDPLPLIDSGLDFDPRFATGPFLFRAGNLPVCRDSTLCPVTFVHTERLDADPPRFILTGSERRSPKRIKGGMDGFLDRWAERHGYSANVLPFGRILWVSGPRARIDQRAQHPAHRL